MSLGSAVVEFVPLRNDLANLPQSLTGMLMTANIPVQNAVVELQLPASKEKKDHSKSSRATRFLGWTGLTSAKGNTIEIDPTFASTLGISHGETVKLSVSAQAPLAHSIYLEPVTLGDWEIVETHVAFLETYMINQVRAVSEGQPITVFPSATALATLRVTKIVPPTSSVARISPNSEIIVSPKTSASNDKQTSEIVSSQRAAVPAETVSLRTRVSGFPHMPGLESRDLIIKGKLPGIESGSKVFVSLITPPSIGNTSSGAGTGEEAEYPRARNIMAIYELSEDSSNGISYGLGCALGLQGDLVIGAQVHVRSDTGAFESFLPISATLHPFSMTAGSKQLSTKNYQLSAADLDSLNIGFVGKGLVVPPLEPFLPNGGIFDTDSKEWGKIAKAALGQETALAESKRIAPIEDFCSEISQKTTHKVVGQNKLLDRLERCLLSSSGVLLYGSRGSGKTAIINSVLARLRSKHIRPLTFKCGSFAEKALPTVRDALKKTSLEAQWLTPCVVVFDNIDLLIPAQQEQGNDSARQQQLAEVFRSIWGPLLSNGNISLLATAQDQADVHAYLLSSHLLDSVVHLKSPEKALREEILRCAMEFVGLVPAEDLDYIEVVSATEGYQPCDLWTVVERLSSIIALNESEATGGESGLNHSLVSTSLFLSATADFTPASLRGVKLERPSIRWDDVGGLDTTKSTILETLEWPTKYAPIFANCPLRLRSGLLLYGYPGCGKTMLASAIASRTGLNFISVKGPEILNKYIGASEQSVRDLFDRAQAAKPCVLFFDEFDSIAPKRGHDATGVTDRVVNQLLTQMDGAEGLDGVYVLAATSRPDMIDSALLRPGRLDKSLLCGLPSIDDRFDIMTRASKSLKVLPEVDLREIAEKTTNFSGADLQALVYTAYLNAVHKLLDTQKLANDSNAIPSADADGSSLSGFQLGPGDLGASKLYIANDPLTQELKEGSANADSAQAPQIVVPNIRIDRKDFEKALKESKPSISIKELNRFKAIYAEFSTDRNGEMPPGISSTQVGARVTLQ